MAVSVTINTNSDQDERLERMRMLLASQGLVFVTVDDMAKGALLQKLKEWEETVDAEETARVIEVYRNATNAQRLTVRQLMNTAPVIVLSGTQSVGVNETAVLSAAVTDDGLPDNTVTYAWTFQSGPSTPTLESGTNEQILAVSMGTVGTYVFRFTADDGDKSSFADISVVVS